MYHNVQKSSVFSVCTCKATVVIPSTVHITLKGCFISVVGILGELFHKLNKVVFLKKNDAGNILIYTNDESSVNKALIGTTRALIHGMIVGVTAGFVKKLQLIGIGYRASITNEVINLIVGFSHSLNYKLPIEVKATCVNQTEIILTSINKQLIGQVAADLRSLRPPEPFKGKGIRYMNEIVRNKDAKKSSSK